MKKVIKIVVGVFAVIVLLGIIAGGSDDNSSSQSKTAKTENVKWNTNFDDPIAIGENLDNCKKIMMKMDSVAANAKKVSPAEVLKNPSDYFGIVLEKGATIDELQNLPQNRNVGRYSKFAGRKWR